MTAKALVMKAKSTWMGGTSSAPTTVNEPLRVVVGQNRLIKYLGYDNVVYYEDAPEFAGAETVSAPA